MIKYAFALILVCVFTACQQPANSDMLEIGGSGAKHTPKDLTINPGEGIGQIKIGSSADKVIKTLGTPDAGDAAMGASLMVWYAGHQSNGHRTSVYLHRNYNDKDENLAQVKAIRITSPDFYTADMIHTGLPLDSIKSHYSLSSNATQSDKRFTVYDDNQAGIAFEINRRNRCSAIIVFAEGGASVAYLDLR